MSADHASYETPELARAVVDILREERIHPVLVFGTQSSGKTVALQSLFHYAKSNDDALMDIKRGAPIWPEGHSAFQAVFESGRQFLDSDLTVLDERKLPAPTQREVPFFIPADVDRTGQRTRFAFLEGMGEWFQREPPPVTAAPGEFDPWRSTLPFRSFKLIVSQVLRTFEHGISIVFVAPSVDGYLGEPKEYAHECLANAMSEVEKLRGDKNRDNLLLLVSKWDAICSPGVAGSNFSEAPADFVMDTIRSWRFVWPKFSAIGGFPPGAKALMPYSAAWVQSDRTIVRSDQYKPIFNRFNRTLWNWLYGNASTAFVDRPRTTRVVLYPDVVPPQPTPIGSYEWMVRALTNDGPSEEP